MPPAVVYTPGFTPRAQLLTALRAAAPDRLWRTLPRLIDAVERWGDASIQLIGPGVGQSAARAALEAILSRADSPFSGVDGRMLDDPQLIVFGVCGALIEEESETAPRIGDWILPSLVRYGGREHLLPPSEFIDALAAPTNRPAHSSEPPPRPPKIFRCGVRTVDAALRGDSAEEQAELQNELRQGVIGVEMEFAGIEAWAALHGIPVSGCFIVSDLVPVTGDVLRRSGFQSSALRSSLLRCASAIADFLTG